MASLKETLDLLLQLQDIDKQIQRAQRSQKGLDTGSAAEAAANSARNTFETKNAAYHTASTELKDNELKLASIEAKVKQYQQKLYQGTVTNAKELSNIEKEVAALGRQRSDLDSRVLELMDTVDQLRSEMDVADEEAKVAQQKLETAMSDFRIRYDGLTQELDILMRQRNDVVSCIEDKALLKKYEDLRAKSGGIGIAKIANQNCGGCNMTLPTTIIKNTKDLGQVQICENCGRILAP